MGRLSSTKVNFHDANLSMTDAHSFSNGNSCSVSSSVGSGVVVDDAGADAYSSGVFDGSGSALI